MISEITRLVSRLDWPIGSIGQSAPKEAQIVSNQTTQNLACKMFRMDAGRECNAFASKRNEQEQFLMHPTTNNSRDFERIFLFACLVKFRGKDGSASRSSRS